MAKSLAPNAQDVPEAVPTTQAAEAAPMIAQVPPAAGETMVRLSDVQAIVDRALTQQQQAFSASLEAFRGMMHTGQPMPVVAATPPPPNMMELVSRKLAAMEADQREREAELLAGDYIFEISKPSEKRMTRRVGGFGYGARADTPGAAEQMARLMAEGKYRAYFGITSEEPGRLMQVQFVGLAKDLATPKEDKPAA